MPSALTDLKILDFSRVLAGPFATMMLADLGATVTKIEPPGGDETRHWGPPYDDAGDATYFQAVNRNKQSLVLDLTKSADLDRALALARDTDVMVENFRSGVTERFGLDYESVRRDNPGVIYCSITGFGRGKGAILPGYDLLIQAVGGLMSITGSPDGEPQKVGVALVDLLSALLGGLVNQASAYTVAGVVPERMGNRHPSIAPYEPLRCADRELVLAVGNDRQFAMLCDVLGVPELARDPRFAVNAARVENRDALHGALEERLRTREASAWAAALSEAGVPAGVVNDIAAAFELARELGLAPVVPVGRDDGTTVELTRNPIGLSVTPPSYRSAPPRFPGPN
jgi:crotonobetainyl-CoA:carnitine CoA-transferase CaiB-like acyl-CoA transferase